MLNHKNIASIIMLIIVCILQFFIFTYMPQRKKYRIAYYAIILGILILINIVFLSAVATRSTKFFMIGSYFTTLCIIIYLIYNFQSK